MRALADNNPRANCCKCQISFTCQRLYIVSQLQQAGKPLNKISQEAACVYLLISMG